MILGKISNVTEFRYVVIPHKQQRYNTVGDYRVIDGVKTLFISDLGDWRFNYLVGYHEASEIPLCELAGITDESIDEFDLWFDANREPGDTSEPGDHSDCPYFEQHQFATKQEKLMAKMLGVDWDEYDGKISQLMKERSLSGQDN